MIFFFFFSGGGGGGGGWPLELVVGGGQCGDALQYIVYGMLWCAGVPEYTECARMPYTSSLVCGASRRNEEWL